MSIIATQGIATIPEAFQSDLITALTTALLSENPPPCVLNAPTGSGKTVVNAKTIVRVSEQHPTIWIWFVPYIYLVQQTESTIAADAPTLHPVRLEQGVNQNPARSTIIITTSAALAKGASRKSGYTDGEDDRKRSLAAFILAARAQGLEIGVVIDEAHIGVESETEFGQLVRWLQPKRILMATATPKDKKLNAFIAAAKYEAFQPFNVSRRDVVEARLNKRFIETVIYDLRESLKDIVDLQSMVLKQGWKRNQRLARVLANVGLDITPLLLVQVGNGEGTIAAARDTLIKTCGVPPGAIGEHSSDAPDPVLMAQIANDSTKQVLIFKQSAGTGFDAPRAFVLSSTKPVNDPDFAMQFMGRVMRVHRAIRTMFAKPTPIPEELDTAYIYLANAQAQQGFEDAVRAASAVKTELQALTEQLVARPTGNGGVHLSNRPVHNTPLFYEVPAGQSPESPQPSDSSESVASGGCDEGRSTLPWAPTPDRNEHHQAPPSTQPNTTPAWPILRLGETASLDGLESELDLPQWAGNPQSRAVLPPRPRATAPRDIEEALQRLSAAGITAYPIKRTHAFSGVPNALKAELRPVMEDMAAASKQAATRLTIEPEIQRMAIRLALGKITETEVHKELSTGLETRKDVAILIERRSLAQAAKAKMASLPQIEDADARILVNIITKRMLDPLREEFSGIDEDDRPCEHDMERMARDCAHWVIIKSVDALSEALFEAIAMQAKTVDADPLPDFMLFGLSLPSSSKNIYGIMPPTKADMVRLNDLADAEMWAHLKTSSLVLQGRTWRMAEFDGTHAMDSEELAFAKALDSAKFVHWWHRNPDRKPYAVRLVRGEHKNYFHPDFVVCLEHYPGDNAIMRLIETKESIKDAVRKAKRFSDYYGKVLFLTKDRSNLRWINDDGSMGGMVDLDDLGAMREWLRSTKPSQAAAQPT